MRDLTAHLVRDQSLELIVHVVEDAHRYMIRKADGEVLCGVDFQTGPILTAGVNGVTCEALLAIMIDRLATFQAGAYACKANEYALDHMDRALLALRGRTAERIARGVEGTMGL